MNVREIYTAPAGSSKTRHAIQTILQGKTENPWGTIWVLLPTNLQVSAFRERLLQAYVSQGLPVFFGVEFFNFYQLYNHLLDRLRVPNKQINQASVYRIFQSLLQDQTVTDQLHYVHPIIDKPGFIDLAVNFIFELKQAFVKPEDFLSQINQLPDGDFRAKAHDIAILYDTYQYFLRENDLVDREGAGWLALAELEREDVYIDGVSRLIVDGFTQFSPLQAKLLNELTEYIPQTMLTLTHEAQRATTVHRTFEHTLQRLRDFQQEWNLQSLQVNNTWQKDELTYLQEHFMSTTADAVDANDALKLIEAPDLETEVRMVMRDVKRKILNGVDPEEIVILMRNTTDYVDLMRNVAERYDLPVMFREGIALNQNPAIDALLDLLRIHDKYSTNFRRQAVMDILRTPYFRLPFTPSEIDTLERISLRFKVIDGRDKWIEALEIELHLQQSDEEPPKFDVNEVDADDVIPTAEITEDLIDNMRDFFDMITPPSHATAREYIAWIEDLIGNDPVYEQQREDSEIHVEAQQDGLNLIGRIRDEVSLDELDTIYTASQSVITRDLHAIQQLRRCLLDMLSAYELLGVSHDDTHEMSWQTFMTDLERALRYYQTETIGSDQRSGHILVTSVFEARGLPHNLIYIMGLSEGKFPATRSEDPLFSDRERTALNHLGIQVATTTQEEDDTSIFYTCAAMAQQQLILSRPTIDEKANLWEPSVLWQSTTDLLINADLVREKAGQPPAIETSADYQELMVSVAYALSKPPSKLDGIDISRLRQFVSGIESEMPHIWDNVDFSQQVQSRRETVVDKYAGILSDETLLQEVASTLTATRKWSASQFNDFGYCPYRFFARRILKLQQFEEPFEGLDAMQLGTLQHSILEFTYGYFKSAELAIEPENLEEALKILKAKATSVFADAPRKLQFRESRVWEMEKKEILLRLEEFITQDFVNGIDDKTFKELFGEGSDEPRYVYAVEKGFGVEGYAPAEIDGAAGTVLARGLIDRIDRIGDRLIIIDYKSGVTLPNEKDIKEQRNFQMLAYLVAAKQLMAKEAPDLNVTAGVFWSLRRPDKIVCIDVNNEHLIPEQQRLHQNVLQARQGDFRVQPSKIENGKCYKYCEFHDLCRFTYAMMQHS